MAKLPKSKSILNPKQYRRSVGLNQSEFWSRFGITQSGGSRYENARDIPRPVQMLMWLHEAGRIDDQDLQDALKMTSGAVQTTKA